jgi:large subunit ribosomal protein L18
MANIKVQKKIRRSYKTRTKLRAGLTDAPRLSIFRSNKSLSFQIIDDTKGKTLASAYSRELDSKLTRMEQAEELGKLIAKKAKEKNITTVVFDRGSAAYHGLVKKAAEGAREGGLIF